MDQYKRQLAMFCVSGDQLNQLIPHMLAHGASFCLRPVLGQFNQYVISVNTQFSEVLEHVLDIYYKEGNQDAKK
jgi:hypothetical protein